MKKASGTFQTVGEDAAEDEAKKKKSISIKDWREFFFQPG